MLSQSIAENLGQSKHFFFLESPPDDLHRDVSAMVKFRIIAAVNLLISGILWCLTHVYNIDSFVDQRHRKDRRRIVEQVHPRRKPIIVIHIRSSGGKGSQW